MLFGGKAKRQELKMLTARRRKWKQSISEAGQRTDEKWGRDRPKMCGEEFPKVDHTVGRRQVDGEDGAASRLQ